MKISLYFLNWNDSFYLPFIKEHYGKFCDKIVMYDNYSSDDSYGLAKRLGFETRTFGTRGELNDQDYLNVKNHAWKEERGKSDYVIVCDADEFIERPYNLTGSCPVITGYNMISDKTPVNSIFEINTGSEDVNYAKQIIFDPNKVQEINYAHGCHKNYKTGDIAPGTPLNMYHFRMIRGVENLLKRHSQYRQRMSAFNKQYRMGWHYQTEDNQKREEWNYLQSKALELW